MQLGPFDTLPQLSKNDALQILNTPLKDLKFSSDYYKAVFHLSRYCCPDSEKALLKVIKSKSIEQPFLIAKRKAIEILGRMRCRKAIPYIKENLKSKDPYIIENSAWALQEIGCEQIDIHNLIGTLLNQPNQNHRVLIQSLAKMGAVSELSKIENIFNKRDLSSGSRGAAIAAIKILTGKEQNIDLLRSHLDLDNQNDRQFAVQDIIDAKAYQYLEFVISTPISPFFRLRALRLLWPSIQKEFCEFNLLEAIDFVLLDDPRSIRLVDKSLDFQNYESLINELLCTDFCRCYLALTFLLEKDSSDLFPELERNWFDLKKDYGALYFLLILFRCLTTYSDCLKEKAMELVHHCLDKSWPDFMKFKPQAILVCMKYDIAFFNKNLDKFLDEVSTPYWASRYATLICVEKLIDNSNFVFPIEKIIKKEKDENQFVRQKAKSLILDFYKKN